MYLTVREEERDEEQEWRRRMRKRGKGKEKKEREVGREGEWEREEKGRRRRRGGRWVGKENEKERKREGEGEGDGKGMKRLFSTSENALYSHHVRQAAQWNTVHWRAEGLQVMQGLQGLQGKRGLRGCKIPREIGTTVDSRSNGSAYNKNPSLTTFFFVPMEFFLLIYIMAITTFHSNNKFH